VTGLRDSDRYLTPPHIRELVEDVWGDAPDFDPFYDPAGPAWAYAGLDAREGADAYRDPWAAEPDDTVFANGPYSGRHPALTAKRIAHEITSGAARRVLSLCPAAIGSAYWSRYVWPHAYSVACLGRLPFVAAVDQRDKQGRLVCAAGEAANGNRTEIALVCYSERDDRAFAQVFARAGYPVVRHA
jgi:hypothetical protein